MKRNTDSFLRKADGHGYVTIQSEAPGMGYIIDPHDKDRIMIVTETGGGMVLNKKQLSTLVREAEGVMEVFTK